MLYVRRRKALHACFLQPLPAGPIRLNVPLGSSALVAQEGALPMESFWACSVPRMRTAILRFPVALLVLLGFAGCSDGPGGPRVEATSCPIVRLARAPLEARGDMLFVHARIDGEPIKLLVDTGAERTLLTEATVDRLHLPRDFQHATRTFGIGSPTATWDAKLRNGIELGGTEFPVDRVTVGRFAINEAAGNQADGLLGADVLLAFDIDLNLPAHEMTLYKPRYGCPDASPPWHEVYVSIDGVSTRRDRLLLPFELDGVGGTALLDTGAQMSSISQQMAERIGLVEGDFASDRTVMAHGAAPDQIPVRIHRFVHCVSVRPRCMRPPCRWCQCRAAWATP